ncbi:hypothetical protein D3C81_2126330 [compost metagenome]
MVGGNKRPCHFREHMQPVPFVISQHVQRGGAAEELGAVLLKHSKLQNAGQTLRQTDEK